MKWECNSRSATEKNLIADENKAKADQPKDDTKKTETDNQSNAMKEKHGKSPLTLEAPNQVSLGQLWLELLKFYTLDFALEEYVIRARIQDILTRLNKNWPKRRIAIEDPFSVKGNVARSLNSQLVYVNTLWRDSGQLTGILLVLRRRVELNLQWISRKRRREKQPVRNRCSATA